MKRIITLILVIVLVMSAFVGCDSFDVDKDEKEKESDKNVLIETENYKITSAMAAYVYKDICYSSMEQYGFDSFIADYEEVTEYLEEVVLFCEEAKKAGIELSEDHLVDIEVQLHRRTEICDSMGKTLEEAYGKGVTKDVIREVMKLERLAEFARADKKLELEETLINDDKSVKDYSARRDSKMNNVKYICYEEFAESDFYKFDGVCSENRFKSKVVEIILTERFHHELAAEANVTLIKDSWYAAAHAVLKDYLFRIKTPGLTLDFAAKNENGLSVREIKPDVVSKALGFFGADLNLAPVEAITKVLIAMADRIDLKTTELDYDEDVNPSGDVEFFTWLYDGEAKDNKLFVNSNGKLYFVTEGPKYTQYTTRRASYIFFEGDNAEDDASRFLRIFKSGSYGSFDEAAMTAAYQGIELGITVLPGDVPAECFNWLYAEDPSIGIVRVPEENRVYVMCYIEEGAVSWWVAAYRGLVAKKLAEWEDELDEKYEIKTDESALNKLYSGLN